MERRDPGSIDRAVLIGAGEFSDQESFPDLPAVARNIASLQHLLLSRRFGLDAGAIVVPPTGSAADCASTITDVVSKHPPPQGLFFYFAGHGVVLDGEEELYLIVDRRTTRGKVSDYGLKASEVFDKIIRSNAALRVVVLDCCDAARGLERVLRKYIPPVEGRRSGTYAVASSTRGASAFAPKGAAHTAFSGVLIDILDTGLRNDALYLDVDEIFRAVEDRAERHRLPEVQIFNGLKGQPAAFAWNAYYPEGYFGSAGIADAMLILDSDIQSAMKALRGSRGRASTTQLTQLSSLIDRARELCEGLRASTESGGSEWSTDAVDDLSLAIASVEDNVDRYMSTAKAGRRRRRMVDGQRLLEYSLRQIDSDEAVLVERKRALLTSLEEVREALRSLSRTSA